MVDVLELKQRRGALVKESRKILDAADARGESLTAEEKEKYDKMDAEVDALGARIAQEERQIQREAELARAATGGVIGANGTNGTAARSGGVHYLDNSRQAASYQHVEEVERRMAFAIQGWLRAGKPSNSKLQLEEEHLEAGRYFNIDLRAREICLPIAKDYRKIKAEWRAMSLTAASGGYTVPQGFVNALEVALLAHGGVRKVASVMRTATGNDLPWPTMNDTSNKGEIINEATTFGASVDPTFANVVFKAFKYSSKPILASTEILTDSAFDLAAEIGEALGTRIARIQNDHFTTGAGTTLPKGLTIAGVVGKAAASMTAFTADEVIDLEHSVDPAYRENASFMFHDTVLAFIRKLKEATTNAYIWQPGLQNGVPDRLLGYPYTINQSMSAAFTTGQKLILFGDMSKYKIRDVAEVRLVRLDELYAQTDQVGFVAFMRTDGNLLDAGTRPVKWLALA